MEKAQDFLPRLDSMNFIHLLLFVFEKPFHKILFAFRVIFRFLNSAEGLIVFRHHFGEFHFCDEEKGSGWAGKRPWFSRVVIADEYAVLIYTDYRDGVAEFDVAALVVAKCCKSIGHDGFWVHDLHPISIRDYRSVAFLDPHCRSHQRDH